MCETTDTIARFVAEGRSFKALQKELGVTRHKLQSMRELLEGSIVFPKIGMHTVRGFTGTKKQIIEHFDIRLSVTQITRRLGEGKSEEEAFFTPKLGNYYTVREFYGSTSEILEHFNLSIDRNRVLDRLIAGWREEDAFFSDVNSSRSRFKDPFGSYMKRFHHTAGGITHTVKGLIEHFGLNVQAKTINIHLRNGMSIEEALFSRQSQKYTAHGTTGTIGELIEFFKLDSDIYTVWDKLNDGGMCPEEVFVINKGVTHGSYKKAASDCAVSASV